MSEKLEPEPAAVRYVHVDDPICAKDCGACWLCMRAKHGPLYYLRGERP